MGASPAQDAMLAALAWQVELGADEAIGDGPVNRFDQPKPSGATAAPPTDPVVAPEPASALPETPAVQGSAALAAAADSLDALAKTMQDWDGSPLKAGARNFVFSDGLPGARLMVIGEAPGADEDRVGKPFVGRAGQLLDRMLAAIGLSRTAPAPENAVYIANILPWRPPGNRTPSELEVQTFLPFMERHIALAAPELILSMGNTPTKALMATATGIKRMRGSWVRHGASGIALMPSFHPAYLLRQPGDKRLAWRDLIAVRAALDGDAPPL